MKIFFDCTFLRNRHTGVDVYFFNLVRNLLEIDKENEYTILVDKRYDIKYLSGEIKQYSNYTILRIYSPLPLQVLYSGFFIPFYLRFKKFDVYHNPYFFGPLLKFICPQTNIVITVHDLYHRTVPAMMNKYLNLVFRFFADNAIKKADNVIVISSQTQTDVIKYLNIPLNKLNLIYQALDNKFERIYAPTDNIEKFGLQKNKYILSVGKILPSKGFDDLVKAFGIFVNKYGIQNIKLVIAGMHVGTYVEEIKSLIESLHIEQGVIKLPGYVSDAEIYSLYADASIVVAPSHYEGFGFPILEGMKLGKPVIARNASSLIEIVSNAGLLFNTVDELADDIYKILNDNSLRQSLIEKGFERLKDFSWIESARKTLTVYYRN